MLIPSDQIARRTPSANSRLAQYRMALKPYDETVSSALRDFWNTIPAAAPDTKVQVFLTDKQIPQAGWKIFSSSITEFGASTTSVTVLGNFEAGVLKSFRISLFNSSRLSWCPNDTYAEPISRAVQADSGLTREDLVAVLDSLYQAQYSAPNTI